VPPHLSVALAAALLVPLGARPEGFQTMLEQGDITLSGDGASLGEKIKKAPF